jgi:hypothetical protein
LIIPVKFGSNSWLKLQSNQSKPNSLETSFCVQNRQVFDSYRLNKQIFPCMETWFKVWFIQYFILFRVWYRQVSLYYAQCNYFWCWIKTKAGNQLNPVNTIGLNHNFLFNKIKRSYTLPVFHFLQEDLYWNLGYIKYKVPSFSV